MGWVCPAPLDELLDGRRAAPPDPTPEITAFEVAEGAPAWGFEVLDFNVESELPHIKSFIDRTSALALGATRRALADAALLAPESRPAGSEIGCAYGTMLGCLEAMGIFWNKVKNSNPKFAQPLPFTQSYANSPSSLMCIEFGLRGASATFSGTRLAGVEALLFAYDQIAAGAGDIVIVGASENLAQAAFNHLLANREISRSGAWNDGIIPGEGAAVIVLESLDSATKRGALIYAEIDGVNFFPLDPKATAAPMKIATPKAETVVFVSTPNVHPAGGWMNPLLEEIPSLATTYYTGDMLSVSPLLGVALGAGVLKAKWPLAGAKVLPLYPAGSKLIDAGYSLATGYEPNGTLGVVMLKKFRPWDAVSRSTVLRRLKGRGGLKEE